MEKMAEQSSRVTTMVGPEWLNADFIEAHLQTYFNNEQIKVVELGIRPATAPGENFVSNMYRVQVNFTRTFEEVLPSSLSVIVKAALTGADTSELTLAFNVYKKEIEFYNVIAPKIKQALEKLNHTDQLIADSYGVCRRNDVILLEDLKAKSYCMPSAQRGLNFDEAKIVMEKAATLHAINAVLQHEHPNIVDIFNFGAFSG